MEPSEFSISITQALNTVQSWLNAGDFEKVIQGCQEILKIDPSNLRASSLMRQAEERRFASQNPSSIAPTENAQSTEALQRLTPNYNPEPSPQEDPLMNLQVEASTSSNATASTPSIVSQEDPLTRPFVSSVKPLSNKQRFLAMAIPAVLIIGVGGTIVGWWASQNRDETIQTALTPNPNEASESSPEEKTYLANNDIRLKDLTKMGLILEAYQKKTGHYPSVNAVRAVLQSDPTFATLPKDPRQGEIDKAGKPFGYLYAVYPSAFGGDDQYYILSTLFEDSHGFGSPWSIGAPTTNHPDYRNIGAENVTFIAP